MRDRIAEIIEKEKLTSSKFANSIGIQPSAVSHILSGRNNPSMDVIQRILNNFRTINSDWLILGVGQMYRENGETAKKQPVEVKITPNKPQMASLFGDESENGTEHHKENEFTATQNFHSSQNQSPPPPSVTFERPQEVITKNPESKQDETATKTTLPKRVIRKTIVYYSDSTYEEYNMRLNTEE